MNRDKTIFVTSANNSECRYFECLFNSRALGIPLLNVHTDSVQALGNYENVILYNAPLIYFGGVPNNFEKESISVIEYCHEHNKNLIIFVDTIYDMIYHYRKGLKLLGHDDFDMKFTKISQKEFPVVNSRYFANVLKPKEITFMNFYYGANNYKFRGPSFEKFIAPGGPEFFVTGGCCNLVPKDSHVTKLTDKKIPYSRYLNELNDSLSTILIYDERWKKKNLIIPSWRFIESWTSSCVCFIEDRVDPEHTYIKDDFFYVSSFEDLSEKIKLLEKDFSLRLEKLNEQIEVMNLFDKDKFREEYWQYLEKITSQ